jgi:phosphopantothenoylcysteine decarboxylase / phosphopantothenate---cysteine ligase
VARVVLGVSGGIAAYKSATLLRLLREGGHTVRVVPTRASLQFVGVATWAALSGQPVATDVWDDVHQVPHVALGQQADLVVVAPATADLLARAVHGRADDLLTSVLLTARCPVVMAPAMHTEMWEHPATRANVATLRERGVLVVEPAAGRLTGADSGVGRLPEPEALAQLCRHVLTRGPRPALDLAGRTVVVSAGGTREPLDPVRFLGNRSSGKQGYALAATAVARGARVVLVSANVELPVPAGVELVEVGTAEQLRDAVLSAAQHADAVVMAAAVADFRPAQAAASKLKKGDAEPEPVRLARNPDVLAELVAEAHPGRLLVGFAAETGDEKAGWLDHGRAKLRAKGCDLLVVNQVGEGMAFGTDDNAAVVVGADGSELAVPLGPKEDLAEAVWDAVLARLPVG